MRNRLGVLVVVLFGVTLVAFEVIHAIPNDLTPLIAAFRAPHTSERVIGPDGTHAPSATQRPREHRRAAACDG